MLPRTGWWRLGQPIGDFGSVSARDKFRLLALSAIPNPRPECSLLDGGLNRSPQHFILEEKMECSDGSEISARLHCGREDGVMGSLATG
jgi:hypothetical protein